MADLNDFNKPTISDLRTDVQDTNRAHHARAIKLDPGTATNRPVGAKLAELISNVFTLKNWNGTSYDTWLNISNFVRGLLGSADAAAARTTLVAVGQTDAQNNAYTAFTTAGTSTAYTLTPTPAFTAYVNGAQTLWVTFHTSNGASATLNVNGLGARAILEEDSSGGNIAVAAGRIAAGKTYPCVVVSGGVKVVGLPAAPLLRNFREGFRLSFSGANATIASGQCADSSNAVIIDLSTALTKTTSAWAAGSGVGGLDTGAIANDTAYHFYAIRNSASGAVDVVFSLASSWGSVNTTLIGAAGFSLGRWIGTWRTASSGQWYAMTSVGAAGASLALTGTAAALTFNSASLGGSIEFVFSTNGRVTCVQPCVAQISANIFLNRGAGTAGIIQAWIYRNGNLSTPQYVYKNIAVSQGEFVSIVFPFQFLTAGEYIQVFASDSGTTGTASHNNFGIKVLEWTN